MIKIILLVAFCFIGLSQAKPPFKPTEMSDIPHMPSSPLHRVTRQSPMDAVDFGKIGFDTGVGMANMFANGIKREMDKFKDMMPMPNRR